MAGSEMVEIPLELARDIIGTLHAAYEFHGILEAVRQDQDCYSLDSDVADLFAEKARILQHAVFGECEESDVEAWGPEVDRWARGSEICADLLDRHAKDRGDIYLARAMIARGSAGRMREAGTINVPIDA